MPENHQFKRTSENERNAEQAEKDKIEEHEDKVTSFQWGDAEEDEGELLKYDPLEVNECVSLLSDHILNGIIGEHFSGMDTSGMRFVIPVDLDLHCLIKVRFEEKWSLDSRIDMFEDIRIQLSVAFSPALTSGKRNELDEKIQEALPSTRRKKFVSGEVSLEADAMVIDDKSDMVSVEIPIHFAAN